MTAFFNTMVTRAPRSAQLTREVPVLNVPEMAKVQKLLTGRDSQTHGAVLKVANRSGRQATLPRPVQHIYPIGIVQPEPFDETENAQNPELKENRETEPLTHPQRNSALRARDQVRAWTSEIVDELD